MSSKKLTIIVMILLTVFFHLQAADGFPECSRTCTCVCISWDDGMKLKFFSAAGSGDLVHETYAEACQTIEGPTVTLELSYREKAMQQETFQFVVTQEFCAWHAGSVKLSVTHDSQNNVDGFRYRVRDGDFTDSRPGRVHIYWAPDESK